MAFSANDAIFGSIQVTWQNHNVTNLFSSRVELINQTGIDLTNVKVKVYTGDTLLLGQRTEIVGTTHVLKFTDEFSRQLEVLPGQGPTADQFNVYNHTREYVVPVFNRGQRTVMTYLSTTPSAEGPSVWLDVLHQGVRAQFRPLVPQVHGVATRTASAVGLAISVGMLAFASLTVSEPWAAGLLCLLVGLFAQSVGAFAYRGFLFLKALVLR